MCWNLNLILNFRRSTQSKSIQLCKLNRELTMFQLKNMQPVNKLNHKSQRIDAAKLSQRMINAQKKMTFEEIEDIRKMKTKITTYTTYKSSNILNSEVTMSSNKLIPPNILDMTGKARSVGMFQNNVFGKTGPMLKSNKVTDLKRIISETISLYSSYYSKETQETKRIPLKKFRSQSAYATLRNYIQSDKGGKILPTILGDTEDEDELENPLSEEMLVLLMHYIEKIKKPTLKKYIRRKSCCCSFCGKSKLHKGDLVILEQDLPRNLPRNLQRKKPRIIKNKRQGFSHKSSGSTSFLKFLEANHKQTEGINYYQQRKIRRSCSYLIESRIGRILNANTTKYKELIAAGDNTDPDETSDNGVTKSTTKKHISRLRSIKNREEILKKIKSQNKPLKSNPKHLPNKPKLTPRAFNISLPTFSLKSTVLPKNPFVIPHCTTPTVHRPKPSLNLVQIPSRSFKLYSNCDKLSRKLAASRPHSKPAPVKALSAKRFLRPTMYVRKVFKNLSSVRMIRQKESRSETKE
ncbi:unnamed protein product [Moneuplotes crassus]|uniref:Uncharacterized protein n=1 Tax=Euplotes crassus TaxID=5936 RepID=A0AAD1U6I9_EUPCR|nr:unnamed protein product [Moneuplotes crassus]